MEPEQLERLRRDSGFAIDREGRLWHRGELVSHPGVQALLLQGLTVNDAGEAIVQVPQVDGRVQWAYVQCEGTPWVVTAARLTANELHLRLNTGESVVLPLMAVVLRLEGEHDLHVGIHDGRHQARFGRAAWTAVAGDLLDVVAPSSWLGLDR